MNMEREWWQPYLQLLHEWIHNRKLMGTPSDPTAATVLSFAPSVVLNRSHAVKTQEYGDCGLHTRHDHVVGGAPGNDSRAQT